MAVTRVSDKWEAELFSADITALKKVDLTERPGFVGLNESGLRVRFRIGVML